jgi:glycosyltransferase involved in cell wall biosynthesis
MGLRLGFHYHTLADEKDGALYMIGYMGRFIDSLAKCCESITCFLHSPGGKTDEIVDYPLKARNVQWVNLGPKYSVPHRELIKRRYATLIRNRGQSIDAMLIRGPSPMLPIIAQAINPKPIVLLIVGDYVSSIDDMPVPRWRREAIRVWAWWNKLQEIQIAKRSLVFVNNRRMFDEFYPIVKNLVEVRTTTLDEIDFYDRQDTCQAPPYHMLYTGHITKGKGVFDIIRAVGDLIKNGEDLHLDLVGLVVEGESIKDFIGLADKLGISDRVTYHGYRTVGPELFAFYRRADIYVIASQLSEGFPRTIWEAMANSVPVVATRVGGIPGNIEGAAVLVEPNSVDDLTRGISSLLHDSILRQQLIRRGREVAGQNTLSIQANVLIKNINAWIQHQKT